MKDKMTNILCVAIIFFPTIIFVGFIVFIVLLEAPIALKIGGGMFFGVPCWLLCQNYWIEILQGWVHKPSSTKQITQIKSKKEKVNEQ